MDTASVSKSDDRSAVMHDGDNMSTANIDMAASFNSDDILPPDTEEGGGDNGSEDTDDDDNVYPAVVKSDNILPPEWESDSESETELLDDDLLRRLDEHKRKTKELNEEARTAREQAWNERHKEAMIATYGTQEGRSEDEVTLCGSDDWEPTALSICIWIGLELLLCRQRGKLCYAGRLCRGVDALRSFWKRKIPGWKLSALDKKKIDNCIGKHISEGSMVRCTLDAMFKKVMPDA